jgi:GntR family histidine utilization transcriptional repressor
LGLTHDTDVLAVRCLHRAQKRPFAIEDRILNLAAVPDAANADFSIVPPGTWLLEHVPWSDAENRISAHNADRTTADALAVPLGAACLLVTRRTWRADATITRVHLTFPGDRYQLIARFTPTIA